MSEKKRVELTEVGQWILFRGLACHMLEVFGLTERELGCGLWEFTECLDMSFEEIKDIDLVLWDTKIEDDIKELKKDIVKEH